MSRIPRAGGAARLALLAVVGVAAALVPSSGAAAATFNCDASAVRGSVLGQPIEPVTANRGQPACKTASAGGTGLGLPTVLGGAALSAATAFTGPANRVDEQQAGAQAGVSDLHVLSLPDLPIQLPTASLPPIPPVSIPGVGSIDLTPAVQALLPNGKLPSVDLVHVQAIYSTASAKCVNGAPQLDGASSVAGLSVLGTPLGTDQAVQQTLQLIGGQTIDPSNANLLNVLPANVLNLPGVRATLQAALDALPDIQIPATLATVRITPGTQTRSNGGLTQQALGVQVAIAGQAVADLTLGEARVSAAGVDCAAATPAAAANQAALQCTTRRLVLTDVLRRGNHVRLVGAADRRYVGRKVSLVFTATGKVVKRVKVRKDGGFSATVPLPKRSLRNTNRARYQARLGNQRSLRLKLMRRMTVTGVRVSKGKVTILGQITKPLAHPAGVIVVKRRVSCKRNAVVARIRPNAQGRFRVTVAAPPRQLAAVYRLATRVRKHPNNRKTYPTFTLPRAVAL